MKEADTVLVEWGFTTLVERFKANGVDEEILGHLTVEDIVALIPEIGIRRKFMEKWKSVYDKVTTPLQEIATSTGRTPKSNVDCQTNFKIESINKEPETSTSKESPSHESDTCSAEQSSGNEITSDSDSVVHKPQSGIVDNDHDENDAPASCKLRTGGKRKAFVGHREFNKRLKEEETLCVKSILKKHGAGKLILKKYRKSKKRFSNDIRRTLIDLVVSEIISDETWYVKC